MSTPLDELALFNRPSPATDILQWPCVELANVAIYADLSASLTDITDVDNDDDIDTYTLEGDLVRVASTLPSMRAVAAFDAVVGTRVRIYNVHTSILRKADAADDDVDFSMDFQVLGETAWYRCLSPCSQYRTIFADIIEKSKFWTWITSQMADVPADDDENFDLFEHLNMRYRRDFNKIRFLGLLLKHHRFIISRLLKDRYWEKDILLRSFLASPEYGPVVKELSKKIDDAAINIDEATSDFLENNIKLRSVASKKRKRPSHSPPALSVAGAAEQQPGSSPRSASVSALFGISPAVTVSNILSFVVHRSANPFDTAAHVLVLHGPNSAGLSPGREDFEPTLLQFLTREIAFQESDWKQLMTKASCMRTFRDRLASHLELIKTNQNRISDPAEFDAYVTYASALTAYFDHKLAELEAAGGSDDGAESEPEPARKDVIITNENEDPEPQVSPAVARHSQKALSRLRPTGSPAASAAGDDGFGNASEIEFQTYLGLPLRSGGLFGSAVLGMAPTEWTSTSFSPAAGPDMADADDGIQLKKSADEAMLVAITLGIQRRLKSAFKLPAVSNEVLSALPPKKWTCPQDECGAEISNCNSPEGRERIEAHYKSHADQYLSAMEAVRLIGAGQHVENLLAKIDNMADLWSNEESKLAGAAAAVGD